MDMESRVDGRVRGRASKQGPQVSTYYRDKMGRILQKLQDEQGLVGVRFCSLSGDTGPEHREKMAKAFCVLMGMEKDGLLEQVSCNKL